MSDTEKIAKFQIGRAFLTKSPESPEEYLQAALEAEQYIKTFQQEDADGINWNKIGGTGCLTFYRGAAGILYMYTKLYQTVKNAEYLEIANKAAKYLSIHWYDTVKAAKEQGEIIDGVSEGFYMGIGGIGIALAEVYHLDGDENALAGVSAIAEYYSKHANRASTGVYWSDNSPVYLDSGVVLFLISAYEILNDRQILNLIEAAADYIISCGTVHADGGLEINHILYEPKLDEPNFEFGSSGIGYMLGKVYEVSHETRFLDAAKAVAKYIVSIAVKQEKGYLIPYKLTSAENLFYLGACHGPAGTSKLFYQLYKITDDSYYYEQIINLVDGMEALGAPLRQSAGYWNTLCVCCGPAGLIPLYIGLYLTDKADRWKDLAAKTANILLGHKVQTGKKAAKWYIAFNRTEPDVITSPAGYLNGAAGIAVMLLQVYLMEKGNFQWNRLIDDPFPEVYKKQSV